MSLPKYAGPKTVSIPVTENFRSFPNWGLALALDFKLISSDLRNYGEQIYSTQDLNDPFSTPLHIFLQDSNEE